MSVCDELELNVGDNGCGASGTGGGIPGIASGGSHSSDITDGDRGVSTRDGRGRGSGLGVLASGSSLSQLCFVQRVWNI